MAGPFLHLDLDAFYASVAQRDEPRLRGKPVAVGGGVVLAASYEARAFGVRSAMSAREARALCPSLQIVSGDFTAVVEASERVIAICNEFTPLVEQISIDEAFLDVRGARGLFGTPPAVAAKLRDEVRRQVELPASVGVATTKFLAKVASRRAKPDGLVVVPKEREREFLHALPVDHVWGVGPATERHLAAFGVRTVGDLASVPVQALQAALGVHAGRNLHALAWNLDPRPVTVGRRAGSVGAQKALGGLRRSREELYSILLGLADRVGHRLRAKDRTGRRLTLRIRSPELRMTTRSSTFRQATASTAVIHGIASSMLDRALVDQPRVTLIGIAVSHLQEATGGQEVLPLEGSESWDDPDGLPLSLRDRARRQSLERSVDQLRARFGKAVLKPGSTEGALTSGLPPIGD